MKETVWHSIFDGKYSISTAGEVVSHKPSGDKLLYQYKHKDGYCEVALSHKGKVYRYAVHRLVGEFFLPNPDKLKNIIHINGNISDNRIENLAWSNSMDNH